ncbi:GerAB/ArcD/ProY family transporter [Desulfosporosinus nitroreducens]|uniref:Spore germination protein n=1 Tax=Desulfosporosinus nitroreducens TaxID=2018668 RepID=A0ABT8QP94_9FIRM|nr:GerAB/ArcD/ProY family transporter [Desulfosporosinus nitroreducens]MDO0823100.1 spore germination protein [Desulfosporosinus nitroreducens]
MGKEQICPRQLFMLIISFELGTTIVLGLGLEAKQDAWIAILLATMVGLLLYVMYTQLFRLFPGQTLIQFIPRVFGKVLGFPLSLLYLSFFIYLAARDLRDLAELIIDAFLPQTPLAVISLFIILVICYAVFHGIEVVGRVNEVLLPIVLIMLVLMTILLLASNKIHITNLQPVLGEGIKPIIKATFPLAVVFPFGEAVVFGMFFPYLNQPSKARATGLAAFLVSGIIISYTTAVNIAVLNADIASMATFPLLATVRLIDVGRFEIIAMFLMFIGAFIKITLYFLGVIIGASSMFRLPNHRSLVVPVGLIIFTSSIYIARSFPEHLEEGLKIAVPILLIPLELIVPFVMLLIAYVRKWYHSKITNT